jgi:hypothetical protein
MRAVSLAQGAVVASVATMLAVGLGAQTTDRASHWRDDLDVFSRTLKSRQIGFAQRNDVVAFDAEIDALKKQAATLSDAAITLRLMKLVAAAHDGHSHVNLPLFAPFRRLPLIFQWYADGLAVMSAAAEYSSALGLRVTRIGTMSPEDVLAAAAPYISHENASALRAESPGYLTTLELLQAIGAADATGRVSIAFAGPGGAPLELSVGPGSPVRWALVDALESRHVPVGVSRRHPDRRYYWYQYLPDTRAMYVKYDKCENDPALRFSAFAEAVLAAADRQRVDRWVVDLRDNSGGSNRVVAPLVTGLTKRPAEQPVFALIGGGTFSAGIDAAMDIKTRLHATLVGEPTGGRPNGWGNAKIVTLPHSGLRVQYSTSFFRIIRAADPPALDPDVPVAAALADVLAGRDPVLDAALSNSARPR